MRLLWRRSIGKKYLSVKFCAILTLLLVGLFFSCENGTTTNSVNLTKETILEDAPPGVPTIDTLTAGKAQVTVSWTAPANTGYGGGEVATITGYTVYYSTVQDFTKDNAEGSKGVDEVIDTKIVVNGLTKDTTYHFLVTAKNDIGEGSVSNLASVRLSGGIEIIKSIKAVHYANNLWVAVGLGGRVLISTDGINWDIWETGKDNILTDVHYANGLWVVVGSKNTIITSTNGIDWDYHNVQGWYILDVHYANNLWVAVGYGGRILTSSDGLDWTVRDSGGEGIAFGNVYYANGLWVAVGYSDKILTSENGLDWTPVTTEGVRWNVHYANNLWVALGSNYGATYDEDNDAFDYFTGLILTSSDGSEWKIPENIPTQEQVAANLMDVHYANNLWVAVGFIAQEGGKGVVLTSSDGIKWAAQKLDNTIKLIDVSYSNGLWVTVGGSGSLQTSEDGIIWTARTSGTGNGLNKAYYDNGLWVAVGDTAIVTSPDGIDWSLR